MVLGVVSDMKNQKKLFTRAGKPRNQWKKVIKLWGQKLWSRFFIGSGIFHRSWTVFSDSPYQKLPSTPFHIASTRCYVPFPYFHVSHAIFDVAQHDFDLYHTVGKLCARNARLKFELRRHLDREHFHNYDEYVAVYFFSNWWNNIMNIQPKLCANAILLRQIE